MSIFHIIKAFNKVKVLKCRSSFPYFSAALVTMKKFQSIVTHCGLEIGGKGIWSLTRSVVQASHVKVLFKIGDVYVVHGYFKFFLHI